MEDTTYQTLLGRLLDLLNFDLGEALDLEQDLRHSTVNGLRTRSAFLPVAIAAKDVLTATVWKPFVFSFMMSDWPMPVLFVSTRKQHSRMLNPTMALQGVDVDDVVLVLGTVSVKPWRVHAVLDAGGLPPHHHCWRLRQAW